VRDQLVVGSTQRIEDANNPYVPALAAALSEQQVQYVSLNLTFFGVIGGRVRRRLRVAHVHWPEHLGFVRSGGFARAIYNWLRFGQMLGGILACRLANVPVVWTVHNLSPHDPDSSRAARAAYWVISRSARACLVHSAYAQRRAEQEFPWLAGRVTVAPHGNYGSAYPAAPGDRERVRAALGAADSDFVLLAFGRVQAYKRTVDLIDAFGSLESSPGDLMLVVAGEPREAAYAPLVTKAAARCSKRLVLDLRRLEDSEVGPLYAAADAAVLHYTELFSSGALLLGVTQGVPVMVRGQESAAELGPWPAIVPYDDDTLGERIEALRQVPREIRTAAAREVAEGASWADAAATSAVVFRSLVAGRRLGKARRAG
jgi:beta-1,4-mannosyltransferase